MKVLIVEDDRYVSEAIEGMVARWGGEAFSTERAETALELTGKQNFDFVLLDLRLPGKSGLWFLERAHLPETCRVIVMSGYAPYDTIKRLFNLGACGYLEKPFGPEELMQELDRHTGAPPPAQSRRSTHHRAALSRLNQIMLAMLRTA